MKRPAPRSQRTPANDHRSAAPPPPSKPSVAAGGSYTRKDSKPLPKPRVNFIPAQSWVDYNWIDRDPDLDMVHHAVAESGMTLEAIECETEKSGHKVSRYTLYGWFYWGVKRPQNATISTVMAAVGWERKWERRG